MVNDAAITYGTALVDDDRHRIGDFTVLGLGESLFCRVGRWRTQTWSTQIADVDKGHPLDVVDEREAAGLWHDSDRAATPGIARSSGRRWVSRVRITSCSTRFCCPLPRPPPLSMS